MSAPEEKPAPPVPTKDAILLIDDEESLLEIFAVALGPYFAIETATSVRDAQRRCGTLSISCTSDVSKWSCPIT
jgi:hypothetical protein